MNTLNATEICLPRMQPFGTLLVEAPWGRGNEEETVAIFNTIPFAQLAYQKSHLYLWVSHTDLQRGLAFITEQKFVYKTNIAWIKEGLLQHAGELDADPDDDFYRVTEMILLGVRGSLRTFAPGRRQTNSIRDTRADQQGYFPPELYCIIEACSPGPFLEVSSRPTLGRECWTHLTTYSKERTQNL